MDLPQVFEHYEISIAETDEDITVSTKGGISKIDLANLESLGWTKYDNTTVILEKPKFVEVEDVDQKRRGLFKAE